MSWIVFLKNKSVIWSVGIDLQLIGASDLFSEYQSSV